MPNSFERTRRVLLLVTVVLLVALTVLTVVFFITKATPSADAPAGESGDRPLEDLPTSGEADGVTLPETPDAGEAYQDSLTFVGDSLTAHLINRGVLTGGMATTQVWRTESNMFNLKAGAVSQKIIYPGPGEHTGRAMTVAEAAALAKPRILIVTLGTDWGVAYLNEQDFKAAYSELIHAIRKASPDTAVLIQSIFPVTADCAVLSNAQIDRANEWVKAVAAETDCRYLDTQSVLRDETGALKAAYTVSGDGIHLNTDAYKVILTYIRTHAVKA